MTKQSRRRVTAADVAAMAGVSRSAVSRAFTEGAYLDAAKRDAILRAADHLGYRPNAMGAALQGAQSNLVAIFVGDLVNAYDNEVTSSLVAGLNRVGKWPVVIGGSGKAAHDAISNILRYPLDAMILRSGSLDSTLIEASLKLNIPVISSGRVLDAAGVDNICLQNARGMAMVIEHLIESGRRRIGYMSGPDRFWSTGERLRGFNLTLAAAGLEPAMTLYGDYTVEGGYSAMAGCDNGQLDALVCANDAMAFGALSWLREAGIDVPKQIAVTGFDDSPMAAWPVFSLTTVRNPVDQLVSGVIDLLDRRTAKPEAEARTVWLEPQLVLRKTHG